MVYLGRIEGCIEGVKMCVRVYTWCVYTCITGVHRCIYGNKGCIKGVYYDGFTYRRRAMMVGRTSSGRPTEQLWVAKCIVCVDEC